MLCGRLLSFWAVWSCGQFKVLYALCSGLINDCRFTHTNSSTTHTNGVIPQMIIHIPPAHTHTHIPQTHTDTFHTYTHIHTHSHTHTWTYISHIHTKTHTRTRSSTHKYTHRHISHIHTHMHTNTHTQTRSAHTGLEPIRDARHSRPRWAMPVDAGV
jgi:predicted small metal-binding protein